MSKVITTTSEMKDEAGQTFGLGLGIVLVASWFVYMFGIGLWTSIAIIFGIFAMYSGNSSYSKADAIARKNISEMTQD
jgi:hypothetical protein